MKKLVIIAALGIFGITASIQAQTATPRATHRQVNQQIRISHGVVNGELTAREVVGLQAQQVHINKTKKRAKADGVVTPRERCKIHRKQKRANKNIAVQKHDRQRR
jgi:hypothetical protein